MEFRLSDEQQQIRQMVREFAETEIRPHVMEWDEAQTFPMEATKKLGELGMLGVIFPEEYGGAGLSYVDYVHVIEELAVVDSSTALGVAAHNSLGTGHIYLAGNEEQKKKWLPKLTSGEWLAAWGLTEPGSGSDASGMRTVAVKDGDDWVINGTKNFITNATYADIAVVLVVTDRSDQKHGITAFAIEMDRDGIRPGKKENKLGMRASDTAELILEDCRVPDANVLGKVGYGFIDAMKVLDGEAAKRDAIATKLAAGDPEVVKQGQIDQTALDKAVQKAKDDLAKVKGKERSLVGLKAPLFPLKNPGIISIPLGFLAVLLGSLLFRDRRSEALWPEVYARQNTGILASKATAH